MPLTYTYSMDSLFLHTNNIPTTDAGRLDYENWENASLSFITSIVIDCDVDSISFWHSLGFVAVCEQTPTFMSKRLCKSAKHQCSK